MAEREVQRLAKILGNSIVERRKILGMTQIELANRLDMAPDALSPVSYTHLEYIPCYMEWASVLMSKISEALHPAFVLNFP